MAEPASKRCKVTSEAVGPVQLESMEGGSQLRVSFTLPAEALQHARQTRELRDFPETAAVSLPTSTSDVLSWLAVTLQSRVGSRGPRKHLQDAIHEGVLRVSIRASIRDRIGTTARLWRSWQGLRMRRDRLGSYHVQDLLCKVQPNFEACVPLHRQWQTITWTDSA